MENKILVTGASGFVGSWVCKYLSAEKVVAVVSSYSKPWRLTSLKKQIKLVVADLSDPVQVNKVFKKEKPTTVIHLATHGVYQYQQNDKKRITTDNYMMSVNLLECASNFGVKKFINTGSVFEYGSQQKKVKEQDVNLNDILNEYSAVKMATTALTNSYSEKMKVITIRPFTAFGPTEDPSRFVSATINRCIKNEDVRIAPKVYRDFIYVEDLADAYKSAVTGNFDSGEILNIASGKRISLEKVARLIIRLTKSKSKIVIDKNYIRKKESSCWADISRAKIVLNWTPKTSLEDALKKSVDFVKK